MNRLILTAIASLSLSLANAGTVIAQDAPPEQGQDEGTRAPEITQPYEAGLRLIEEGQYKEAIAALSRAIELDNVWAKPHIARGRALKELQDYQSAGNAFTRALELASDAADSAAAYNGRGECYMEMNPPDYNLAVNDFQNALDLDRTNAVALSNLGHVYASTDPVNALRVLDDALAINPQDARAYRDRGWAHAQIREFDESVEDLRKAIEVDPADHENYAMLATIHSVQSDFADAAQAWTEAIRVYKPTKRGDTSAYILGYLNRADARLRLAEDETDAVRRTAALEGVIGDTDAVLAMYEDRFPESGQAYYRRGRAERMLERYSDAVDSLTRAMQNVPAGQDASYMSDAYLYRGICWYYIGSLNLARGDFEQGSATGNGFQDPRMFLWTGFTFHRQNDFRAAIDLYSEAISKAPTFALAYVNKGRAYMDLEEYGRAVECFEDAIRSEPNVGEHYYSAGYASIQLKEFQKAVDYLNLALRQDNPQPKMYRAMALALRGLGRNELAEEYERQAATAEPAGASN